MSKEKAVRVSGDIGTDTMMTPRAVNSGDAGRQIAPDCVSTEDLNFAARIAKSICRRNAHWRAHTDDCIAVAQRAIWESSLSFDVCRGTSLHQYSLRRVSGAVKDYLIQQGVMFRSGQTKTRFIQFNMNDVQFATPDIVDILTLRMAVDSLKPNYREVVHRYYWEGEPFKDIAKSLNVSERRASQIKNSAIRKLMTQCQS